MTGVPLDAPQNFIMPFLTRCPNTLAIGPESFGSCRVWAGADGALNLRFRTPQAGTLVRIVDDTIFAGAHAGITIHCL